MSESSGLVVEPCVIGDGFLASYWQDGICVTTNENYSPCPLTAAAGALAEAAREVGK